jgi:hypothetical protein
VRDDVVEEGVCCVVGFGGWHILGMDGSFVRRELLGFVSGESLKGEKDGGLCIVWAVQRVSGFGKL